jgi:hypothetical protein
MSQSIFQARPQDAGKGWAIDEYDGRGAWQSTYRNNPKGEPMDKQEAQRAVFQLRRKAVNSAKSRPAVNRAEELLRDSSGSRRLPAFIPTVRGALGNGVVAGGDAAKSSDPYALVKAACEHWYNIGWPEDERPVAMLMRALELLDGSVSGTDAVCTETVGTPGVRDPDHPCDMFSPGKPTNGGCQGDGHHLCGECMLLEVPR